MTLKQDIKTQLDLADVGKSSDSISLNDQFITLRGRVTCHIEETDPVTGNVSSWIHHDKGNIVVNLGKETLCHLITAPQTTRHITTFKLGTKGHKDNDILIPIPPKDTDKDLIDKTTTFKKDFTNFKMYPVDNTKTEVQFSCVLEAGEANGSATNANQAIAYTEAGMYTFQGVLFARETFPAVVKTINRRITFTWSILF